MKLMTRISPTHLKTLTRGLTGLLLMTGLLVNLPQAWAEAGDLLLSIGNPHLM